MKKLVNALPLFVLMMLILLSACSDNKNANDSNNKESGGQKKEGYVLIYNKTSIKMNSPAKPIIETLGNPQSYFESKSCAFNGLDKTYTYSGMQLLTYQKDDVDYIYGIVLMDDTISTVEGVALGDELDKVVSAYGERYAKDNNMITYSKSDSKLSFIMDNDKVASIEYNAIVNEK